MWPYHWYDGYIVFCSTCRLYIHLSKITDLPPRSQRAPTYDTFVNLCLLPDEKHSFNSRTAKNNLNPPFEEVFTFNVDRSRGFENYTLRLSAYNSDLPQWYNAIGHTLVPLSNCVTPDEKPQDFKRKLSRKAKVSFNILFNITIAFVWQSERTWRQKALWKTMGSIRILTAWRTDFNYIK